MIAKVLDAFKGRLAKTTGLTFVLRVGNVGINFVIAIILAQSLGPDNYGLYSIVLALLTVLAIPAQFGIPALVIREVSRARADKAVWRFHDISRWAHRLSLSIGVPLAIIVALLAWLPTGVFDAKEAIVLLAGVVLIVMLPLRALRSGLIRGLDRVVLGQIPGQVVQPLILLSLLLTLIFAPALMEQTLSLTPFTAMAAYSIAVILAWIIGGAMLVWLLRTVERKREERWVIPGWKSALMAFGLTNAMVLVDKQVGLLILGVTSENAEAGFYKVAAQAATFTAMGYVAANMALGPGVAKAWREGKRDVVQAAVIRGSRLSSLFAAPAALVFLVGGQLFLELLFGADYLPAWPAMALLVIGQFINCAFGSSTVLLNMSGNEKQNTRAFLIALAINVALAFALTPSLGAVGAAAATLIGITLRNVILWRAAHRLCGMETGFWGRIPSAAGQSRT
ncbi:MAG: oligosaccharide flippase family protein [Pseudomonadota bacterium]